jgi:hypothetical protein
VFFQQFQLSAIGAAALIGFSTAHAQQVAHPRVASYARTAEPADSHKAFAATAASTYKSRAEKWLLPTQKELDAFFAKSPDEVSYVYEVNGAYYVVPRAPRSDLKNCFQAWFPAVMESVRSNCS